MEPVIALGEQLRELADRLDRLDIDEWQCPSPCEGWTVADVVLHLAQTNELATASVNNKFADAVAHLTHGLSPASDVDESVAAMVGRERHFTAAAVHERWTRSARAMQEAFSDCDPHRRVAWVAGDLSARTLATTRLAETWIHTTDIAAALSEDVAGSDRLALVARLAWRTLPYAFQRAGRELSGPVAFELTSAEGDRVDLTPDTAALSVIRGSVVDLCLVAGRRRVASETSLTGEGPDAEAVLELVRTYA